MVKLMYKTITFFIVLFACSSISFAQEDIQIGKSLETFDRYRGGQYDYSDPGAINIKVLVWGYVPFPGHYIIPSTSSVNDLLALAGGPTQDANIDDLRLFRVNADASQSMIKFDYNDLLWNDNLEKRIKIPDLQPGDILLVPGETRYFFWDYFNFTLTIITTLAVVAALVISVSN
jgi:polysaccharide export outer membrane protein